MLQTASFFRCPIWIEPGRNWKRSAANAWRSSSGIHGAPRLASMSPGSTSSGCTPFQGLGVPGISRSGPLERLASLARTLPDR
jgi:hypothetical protein